MVVEQPLHDLTHYILELAPIHDLYISIGFYCQILVSEFEVVQKSGV
jgi:hypothetical protein